MLQDRIVSLHVMRISEEPFTCINALLEEKKVWLTSDPRRWQNVEHPAHAALAAPRFVDRHRANLA